MKTYYDILGIPKNADNKQIKAAYRKLVKQFHPDANKRYAIYNSKIFEEITCAYSTLINPVKRKEYDNFLESKKNQNMTTSSKINFNFREFKNWLFNNSMINSIFSYKKISKATKDIDQTILNMPIDELLFNVLYSKNIYVQLNAIRALIKKNKKYIINDLLRLLYSNIPEEVKIEILNYLVKKPEKKIKEVIADIYNLEKSLRIKQIIRAYL